jgi:hypothetical protein
MVIKIDFADNLNVSPEDICAFYANNWKRKIVLSLPKFYRWQFINSPDNKEKDSVCLAVNDENQIIGAMGLNKRSFNLKTSACPGAELTTWVISAESKGLGIGGKMIKFLQENFSVLFGSGITDEALPIYLKTGFHYLKALPRFVKVWNIEYLQKFTEVDKLTKQLINKRKRKQINNHDYSVKEFNEADINDCNNSLFSQLNSYSRSFQHLNWRYNHHPYFSFEIFIIQANQKKCCVIFRKDNINNGEFLYVMDMFGDLEAMPAAMGFIEDYCTDNNIQIAEFYCVTPKISRFFVNAGWFSILDETFINFPHLFYPVELRNPPTTSLIYWAKENSIDLLDLSNLYITKQDMDLDRPTIDFLINKEVIARS